ncbi:MAG: tripartite tricarboxylate transporter substrate binding protein [Betaproteobacteria bacterium]|nr:tripartite tricarboxylate transporter substrate binding protein [Betaproteobacteria bacterium]
MNWLILRTGSGACAIVVGIALTNAALAQPRPAETAKDYPNRPIRLVVPSSPGGGTDIIARQLSVRLTERWGQQVIVDNRPGAGQMIGISLVAKSPPDGYTLVMTATPLAVNTVLYKKVPYDPIRDFAPVTQVAAMPNLLVMHPTLPVRNVKQMIALAKSRPGELAYASSGFGTGPHLSMELFNHMADIKLQHVPYKGTGPALLDTISGHVPLLMSTLLPPLPHLKTGRLRALGVTSAKRVSSLPDVPTVAEGGVAGYEVVGWYGIAAPAGTPQPVVAKLQAEISAILHAPETRDKLAAEGAEAVGSKPEEFSAFLKSEIDKWGKVVKAAGIPMQ